MTKDFDPQSRLWQPEEPLDSRINRWRQDSPVLKRAVRGIIQSSLEKSFEGDGRSSAPEIIEETWKKERILFVTGPHASGKSAVARWALEGEDFAIFDTGPILRQYYAGDSSDETFGEWVERHEAQFGPAFTNELLACHIRGTLQKEPNHTDGVVIIGNRSYDGIAYLCDSLRPPDYRIMYVDAPVEILHERYRMREGDSNMTLQEFDEILKIDERMGLLGLAEKAHHHLYNDGQLEVGTDSLKRVIGDWQYEPS